MYMKAGLKKLYLLMNLIITYYCQFLRDLSETDAIEEIDRKHRVTSSVIHAVVPKCVLDIVLCISRHSQDPFILDVRSTPKVIPGQTGTKDLQMVNISLRVLHRPDVEHLPKIYKTIGKDYAERILPSLGNEVLKNVVAQ